MAEDCDRVKSVSYRDNFISGCQRPWLTKDGLWTKKGMDMLSFDEFSDTLNASSDEMRAKPANGISEAACTFLRAGEDLRYFQKHGLLGSGLNSLLNVVERESANFDTLNTFGGKDVRRSEAHVRAAVNDLSYLWASWGEIRRHKPLSVIFVGSLFVSRTWPSGCIRQCQCLAIPSDMERVSQGPMCNTVPIF